MSQVQHPRLHFIQSISIAGTGFIANHLFRIVRGTYKEGFIFYAIMGSLVTYISKNWASKDETAEKSWCRVSSCLMSTTGLIYIMSRILLKERANVKLCDLPVFCLMQICFSWIFSVISQHITLQDREKNQAVKLYGGKNCSEEIDKLYVKGYPVQRLRFVVFNPDILKKYRHSFSDMTENQLLWHVEVVNNEAQYDKEELCALNKALDSKGLPMSWGRGISIEIIEYACQHAEYQETVSRYLQNNPVAFERLKKYGLNIPDWLNTESIPNWQEYIKKIDKKCKILFCLEDFEFMRDHVGVPLSKRFTISVNQQPSFWETYELSVSQQILLSIVAEKRDVYLPMIEGKVTEILEQCLYNEEGAEWLNSYLNQNLLCNGSITDKEREEMNQRFVVYGLPEIQSPIDFVKKAEVTKGCDYTNPRFLNYPIDLWHTYFSSHSELWRDLPENIRTIFVNYFIFHGEPFWCQEEVEVNLQLIIKPSSAEIANFNKYSFEWMEHFGGPLSRRIRSAIHDRRESLKGESTFGPLMPFEAPEALSASGASSEMDEQEKGEEES